MNESTAAVLIVASVPPALAVLAGFALNMGRAKVAAVLLSGAMLLGLSGALAAYAAHPDATPNAACGADGWKCNAALPGVECKESEIRLYNPDQESSAYGWECHEIDTVTFYRDPSGLMNWFVTETGPRDERLAD